MSASDLPPYWPASGQAAAYLERVQKLLTARGLTGAERQLCLEMHGLSGANESTWGRLRSKFGTHPKVGIGPKEENGFSRNH